MPERVSSGRCGYGAKNRQGSGLSGVIPSEAGHEHAGAAIELTAENEQELIALCRRGDEDGYRVLVERYAPTLWRIAHRVTGSRDAADDLSQEAFIRAFRSLRRFRGRSKFSTYLCSIVVNLSLNHVRRRQRRRETPIDDDFTGRSDPSSSPRARAQELEFKEALEKALDALPSELRAALVLTAVEGMSHKEAGTILRCAESTVSWRVHEARKRLRRRLRAQRDGTL